MWRSLRLALPNSKNSSFLQVRPMVDDGALVNTTSGADVNSSFMPLHNIKISVKVPYQRRQSSTSSSSGSGGKVLFGIVASTGLGFAGAVVYGKYDHKFKKLLEENVPFVGYIYKMFPDDSSKPTGHKKDDIERKMKEAERESAISSGLLKKKLDREKSSIVEVPKPPLEPKPVLRGSAQSKDDKQVEETNILKSESMTAEQILGSMDKKVDFASIENSVNDTLEKLRKTSEEALNAHNLAVKTVKQHTAKLYEALDLSEGQSSDIVWKEASDASAGKVKALKIAKQKATETKTLIEKLNSDSKKLLEMDPSNPLVKRSEEIASNYFRELQKAESEVTVAENEAKTAAEYEQLVRTSKDQFRKELQVVLPNYIHDEKGSTLTESDLNLLIAHAHRRIEKLQKQIAKQQVTEKMRVDEAVKNQRMQDELLTESKIQAEMKKRHLDLESAVENRVASLKANFEAELHKQLLRQAAAHADHLQEVLKVQEQELERKHVLELEEKLLHQKGVFISETSGNMARLKGILDFLKAKSEFDKSSKKAQALWLACQAMYYKITIDKSGNLSPLAKDIAAIKIASDESDFINSVLSGIPSDAVNRGVYNNETLKYRFEKVKHVCKKVALVDENNDSLYRYFLSYLQSLLIVDTASIPKEELDGKVAVDTSEWDTFDILSRISYCLKNDDLEQALRYANQLKGEPKVVAKDWMDEIKLLLETQLAVKALLAHAAAIGVQAYH